MKVTAIVDASRYYPEMEGGAYIQELRQTTVIKKLTDTLRQANVDRIIVVTGYDREALEKHMAHRGTAFVYAEDWKSDSTPMWRYGLKSARSAERILVLPGNMPLITRSTICDLIDSEVPMHWIEGDCGQYVYVLSTEAAEQVYSHGDWEDIHEWMQENLDGEAWQVADPDERICIENPAQLERVRQLEIEKVEAHQMSCRTKLMITKGEGAFGPGAARFFTLIDETGSMASACKSMEMSYSRGWTMVRSVEDNLGFSFLERKSGGKGKGCSKLTEQGREFLNSYYAMEADIQKMSRALFALHFGDKF